MTTPFHPSNLLRGDRVRLAVLAEPDFAAIATWYEDAGFLQLFDATPAAPRTPAALREEMVERQKSANDFAFAIRLLDSGNLIGYLEIDGILWSHGVAGFGIGIGDPTHRGKGYGTEAGQLALRFAFEELNLHRITATVFSYNGVSQRMLEKLGFLQEGIFREFLRRGGQRHDMLLYGLLRPEWEAARR
jgi:RimJ/RimL family protein N-acetyltransferase